MKVILYARTQRIFKEVYTFIRTFEGVDCKPTILQYSLCELAVKEDADIIFVCAEKANWVANLTRNNIGNFGKEIPVVEIPLVLGELTFPEWQIQIQKALSQKRGPRILTLGNRLMWRPRPI